MRTRVEISTDGINWATADTVIPRWEDDFAAVKWNYADTISGLKAGTTYYFRIRAENLYGNSEYSNVLRIGPGGGQGETGIFGRTPPPGLLSVHSRSDGMEIAYRVDKPQFVALSVYDLRGTLIKALVRQWQPGGSHSIHWDRRDAAGKASPQKVLVLAFNGYATKILN
jgi:hypothetical protein